MNLLPCPFCGHHATIEESDLDGSPVTGCTNDLCPLGDERFSMTIGQWNTRAAITEQPRPVAFQFGDNFQYVANFWPPENVGATPIRPLYAGEPYTLAEL